MPLVRDLQESGNGCLYEKHLEHIIGMATMVMVAVERTVTMTMGWGW